MATDSGKIERREYSPDDFRADRAPTLSFPEDAWQWFLDACADIELPVSANHRKILEALYSHLIHVNNWLNLTRITSPADYLKFHVFDSLTIWNLVTTYTAEGDIVLDLGSGGGYPGLPLMTWFPERHFILVDSRPKKVSFLKETVGLTPCKTASARCFRGREVGHFSPDLRHACQMVTARAVGRMAELLLDVKELLRVGGLFVCMKGQSYPTEEREEVLSALPKQGFSLVEEHSVALDEADPGRWVIVVMREK